MLLQPFCLLPSQLCHVASFTAFLILDSRSWLSSQFQKVSFLPFFRQEAKVLGEIQQVTMPTLCHNYYFACCQASPQCYSFLIWCPPPELVSVKPETTAVHVMGLFSNWLTLGLPANIWVPPPTKLPGNRSQHSCPLCGDIKLPCDGAYNHICLEHLGVLLQCCFCTWSSGSTCMMREHILKHHQKDDGSCMIAGLEPTPWATCH